MSNQIDREPKKIIGDLVAYKRIQLGMTQSDLAPQFGFRYREYVGQIERGEHFSLAKIQVASGFL